MERMCGQVPEQPIKLTRKELASNQEVRWCPGCGDYAVLAQVQKVLAEQGIPRENFAFVSGIGCSSRFPYYMNTYGFHTIHGRAPGVATGLKSANPELSVWVITGDGDALAIGGNHFIHAIRRNVDLKIILFNNRIYGLTKGQYSPTSLLGTRAKSTPYGSIDRPFNPLQLALGAGASFVARTTDADPQHLAQVIERAAKHRGTAVIEVLQNCVVFNDGSWSFVTDKATRDERQLRLENGKPLLFAKGQKAIRFVGGSPQVVDVGNGTPESAVEPWDERGDAPLAFSLAQLDGIEMPMAFGVLRAVDAPVYHEADMAQEKAVREKLGDGTLESLLYSGDTWNVSKRWAEVAGSEIRRKVLEGHARLRVLFGELEAEAKAALDDTIAPTRLLRERVPELVQMLSRHLELEEEVLLPALRTVDAWGPVRVERIHKEHADQRARLRVLGEQAENRGHPVHTLATAVLQLLDDLREDMRREEAETLTPEALGEGDVVNIDVTDG